MIKKFTAADLKTLWSPDTNSAGEDNGQVVIIGGSSLFQGAPLLSTIAATRIVDMVFLATPLEDKAIPGKIELFSKVRSLVWIPREDLDAYVEKSDAVLIGPGLMRFHKETSQRPEGLKATFDEAGTETKMLTKYLLQKFPNKRWVIDGGSLQVMDTQWIPKNSVLTPNKEEFEMLFGKPYSLETLEEMANKYSCVVVGKGPVGYVSDGNTTFEINGGNAGLTKGGTGDTLAGIIVGLLAKNEPLLSAASASFLIKKTADNLNSEVGLFFNADDVAANIGKTLRLLMDK